MTSDSSLPAGWVPSPLSQVIQPRGEKVLPASMPSATFLGMDHIEAHTTRIVGGLPAAKMKSVAARFYAGDVLYGRLRPYLNKVALPQFDGLASAEFIVLPDTEHLRSAFLKHRLNAADFVSFASHLNEGDRPRVSFDQIGAFPLLLPPPNEQIRIVAKIDELFSELDSGIAILQTASEQLRVYRQALLKHAFEGKLSEWWRTDRKLETSQQLFAQIKKAREEHFQRLLASHREGTRPRQPKALSRISDQALSDLPILPNGWLWEKLGWATCGVEYGTSAKSSAVGEVPVLRMGNIQNAKLNWSDLVYSANDEEIRKYLLKPGDVLFNRTNSPELVGKTGIYRGGRPALFAGYLIRINQIPTIVDSQYLNLFLNSHLAKKHGNRVKTDGVNQSNINGQKLTNYPFPFCQLAEQREIVKVLDQQLSIIDQLENDVVQQLRKADALRQAILKKAFLGQLVAQCASDEPASALLERLRSENQTNNKKTKRKQAA